MPDRLDQLKHELVLDLLRAWVDVYDRAQVIYDSYDDRTRRWIDEHGHRVESLVPVVAFMQPDVRVICRSLVEDALAATEKVSQTADTVGSAVEQVIAQAKSGGEEMGGVEDRMAALEDQFERILGLVERVMAALPDDAIPPEEGAQVHRLDVRDRRAGH